ncbi:MAG: hybrid sensor histidine kinase/response regulator [Xenococcaceae cyanobacterium MO_167.B52]|nr:hybrid sensor histidine kinase/response regulator [Xenococcaceae cyanobacterium MO_167.B52]
MDTEQQIRLNFLDEAEEYFDRMESTLLGLADTTINLEKVDLVLRAAHSIKGGAGMMGFVTLSKVAHRLEDFFKILRVRYASSQIATEIETLLLQSVDSLRHIAELNRQGLEVIDSDISDLDEILVVERTQPIFDKLQQHLGDLEAEDEDALMAQNEDFDPALLVFEEGVDTVLDRFETQLKELRIGELAEELATIAEELIGFGKMANLQPFTQLCQSIQQQAETLSNQEIEPLAEQALKTWRRSHALVLRGSIEKLPSCLEGSNLGNTATIQSKTKVDIDPLEDSSLELSGLQSAFEIAETKVDIDPLEDSSLELSGLQSAFEIAEERQSTIPQEAEKPSPSFLPQRTPSVDKIEKMVRVPASQIKQFNTLFEQLILNRNSINVRLQQLEKVISLMTQRMSQMENSNTQLKQWYGRASLEGFLTNKEQAITNVVSPLRGNRDRFDSLEMDTYSDIHLICQEQIETIVQLQEVATDIKLGIQDINQSVRDLHYTTKSMQGNVTRTQMLPFSEVVKRFPRVIRDLNLQFNKQVNLKIIGENTLLDRSAIEALSDPLMHLLRNAFDHGIEDSETRIKAGKPPSGTITIQAKNQVTYTVITLSDDGGGISLDKIRDRVVTMGIPKSDINKIPEAELLEFIFEPGFSTAKQVTQLSGRGVGMDVVKTNLQEIRGDVKVATKPGKGTTFTLRIPFTLSILRVAVIEQAGIIIAIPANSIRELVPLKPELIKTSENTKNLLWNQTEIPLVEIEKTLVYRRLHQNLNLTGNPIIDKTMAIVIGDEKFSAALQISHFWYEQESTIRPIDSPIPLPPGVISSVVFGDGKVIPLVDPTLLANECLEKQFINDSSNKNLTTTHNLSATKTILVVDDSINVRRYLSLTLEKAGYRVEQAKDGQEAVDKLLGGLSVQAVICDIEMPRLDGYGVLEEIKEKAEFAKLPIAMLTSRSNEKHRKLAINLGASAYFSKPYNEQELLNKLATMVMS